MAYKLVDYQANRIVLKNNLVRIWLRVPNIFGIKDQVQHFKRLKKTQKICFNTAMVSTVNVINTR